MAEPHSWLQAVEDLPSGARSDRPPASRSPRIGRPAKPVAQVRGPVAERVVLSTELDPYMDLRALADYSGIGKRKLEEFINLPPDDALPCYRLSGSKRTGKVLVRKGEFDAWIQKHRSRGRPSLARAIRELGLETA